MKTRFGLFLLPLIALSCAGHVAQTPELGPGFSKVKDGIYVFAPDATTRPAPLWLPRKAW